MTGLVIPEQPELVFRQLHHDLHVFANQAMDDDDALAFMTRLLGHESALLAPVTLPPPQSSERQALQSESKVTVAGKTIDVSPAIQQEIVKLSDEFHVSEVRCLELWLLASDATKREWIERVDHVPAGALTDSIPAAARHLLVSEVEYKLNLLKELVRLRFDQGLDKKRRQFVLTYTNQLLANNLLTKLLAAFQEQLPKMMQIEPLQASASYWHDLLADSILFLVSSTRVLPSEILRLAEVMKALCGRLNTVVAKVSPHIVNLTTFAQLFETGSRAGTAPEGVVKQVSCLLRAMTAMQVALLVVLLDTKGEKMDRETGEWVATGNALAGAAQATTVTALHQLIFEDMWEQTSYQSVTLMAWAAFMVTQIDGSSSGTNLLDRAAASGNVFAEVEATPRVVKAALEKQVFTTLLELLLKYLPDAKHDPLLYRIFESQLELLFINYSARLMVDVPTLADQAALAQMQSDQDGGEVATWDGDCLEDIIAFAMALCQRDSTFARAFWPGEDLLPSAPTNGHLAENGGHQQHHHMDDGNCHEFLLVCRDAAFKNPACLAAYLKLLASVAEGPECAQLAFHHMKQNPPVLSWDHFFAVMNKYQRMLTEAERPPAGYSMASAALGLGLGGVGAMDTSFDARRTTTPGQKFIRPKELEALESIQAVIQAILQDSQLALIFFHNHDWAPIETFVTFLQCRVPSSLKGELMKTLSLFAQVPEIAPYVWRQMDSLQILRTTADVAVYGNEDISYELEHYESLSGRYPATRGFLALLDELFDNPHAWSAFEGNGRVAAIQHYFDFLLDKVFMKFDLRKYEDDEEKWVLANGVLTIFRRILRQRGDGSLAQSGFANQLLQRLLAGGGGVLEKLFYIVSCEGGVESLESTATKVHLEHSFFFCLSYARKQTEATHGPLYYSGDHILTSQRRRKHLVGRAAAPWRDQHEKDHGMAPPRQLSVEHALEILVLVLENDVSFVSADGQQKSLAITRVQMEMLHNILFRYRSDFVNIIQYIKYTKSSYIPQLSVAILRSVSSRVSGSALVDLLADSGASGEVMIGYMNRLLNVYEDEQDHASSSVDSGEGEEEPMSGNVMVQSTKRRKRSEAMKIDSANRSPSSIRRAILDLMLDNLEKPAPNLTHLLLGLLNGEAVAHAAADVGGGGSLYSGLDVLLTLLSTPEFGLEFPDLAQRGYKIVHQLLVQEFSTELVVPVLESARCEFFVTQLNLFARVFQMRKRRGAAQCIGELNMRGWFFKSLAVYVHVVLQREPPQLKHVNRLMSMLLWATDMHEGSTTAVAGRSSMLLLRFLQDSSIAIFPPAVPSNHHAVSLAEQVTEAVDGGCFKWLKIDVERFCKSLQEAEMDSAGGFGMMASKRLRSNLHGGASSAQSPIEALLQWAINWNVYSERVAAESHALNSIRELVEIVVLDYLVCTPDNEGVNSNSLHQAMVWQGGLDAAATAEVRVELISGIISVILGKLTECPSGSAQLFEVTSKIALLLFSELRHSFRTEPSQAFQPLSHLGYLDLIYKSICNTATATGNPVAAQNARTLLYSCIVNVLSVTPTSDGDGIHGENGFLSMTSSASSRTSSAATGLVVDLICRDASEGGDVLSMALAVSALEAMAGADGSAISKMLRERGYLLHFIGIFRSLCEMDASLDRMTSTVMTSSTNQRHHLPQGIDATTIGTIYECFLSIFTRIAGTNEGAVALLEGGLIRLLSELRNLPTHRPKVVFHGGKSNAHGSMGGSEGALRRANAIYSRKWLALVRLMSAVCTTLPQNRTLAEQVLVVVDRHRKLFTSCLKLQQHDQPSLTVLRETSYTTFVFRYVAQFQDLCDKVLNTVQWEKIAQNMLRVFLLYSSEVVPLEQDDAEQMMSDSSSVWWQKTIPQLPTEHRDAADLRLQSCDVEESLLERVDAARDLVGLMRLTLFGEEKLFASRMIICNSVAFCATRMLKSVDTRAGRLLPGRSVLLATTSKQPLAGAHGHHSQGNAMAFPSMESVDRRTFAASLDPLWTHAPALSEMAIRLSIAVTALESAKEVTQELVAMQTAAGKRPNADVAYLTNLVEYHVDSLTFVVENVAVVLLTHFAHYLGHATDSSKAHVQHVLAKVLPILAAVEENAFVHAIARRLRELAVVK